ncbi:MAG: 4-hydroxy-tetrahydrodipicolinate reductase, partial [Sphingomonadales bacterium]|nr:4-hydroxy-tetrahydrodipicolinate reductase [Sphingomonadales bacterium]
ACHALLRPRHPPPQQGVKVEGQERGLVPPIFEQPSRLPPGGAVEEGGVVGPEARESGEVMGAGQHVDAVDLEQAQPVGEGEEAARVHRSRRPRPVEPLGGEHDPASGGERQRLDLLASIRRRRHEATMTENSRLRIRLFGASGRMGGSLARHVEASETAELVDEAPDVFVDFTAPDALEANLEAALAAGKPILVGTTGLDEAQRRQLDRAAERIALIHAPNTSLGIAVLRALVEQAARVLGPDWDAEIVEMHHREKRDTPSGTALLLGAAVNLGRGARDPAERNRFDRMQEGPHAREEGGVYYSSLRGGTVAGEHVVVFAGDGERLELGHRADSRLIFARGALRAALWLRDKPAGRYTMADVLGLA